MNKLICHFFLMLVMVCAAASLGCKNDGMPKYNADARSGSDAARAGALPMLVNTPTSDEVNFDQQDQTDWKQVELKGKPGILTVELRWNNPAADLNCDVYDSTGEQIAASPGPAPGTMMKKIPAQIDNMGIYFLRIQAVKKGDASVYTVNAKWNDEPAVLAPPVVVHHHHAPAAPHPGHFDPNRGVQGRVLSSYLEGGQRVLHIDKGASAGVKVGTTGTILEGPGGANALEGGSFTVTEVIDDSKCVAKTSLKSLGRNTRVSLNVGK